MSRAALTGLIVAAAVWSCATARTDPRPVPADQLSLALQALEAGDVRLAQRYAEALPDDDSTELGRRTLLVRALLALDPRSTDRAPARGAALAARYVATAPDPLDAVLGRFLYAVALDLGAKAPAGAPAGAAALPQLGGPSLAGRLVELEQAVARLRSELTRIQETLKP